MRSQFQFSLCLVFVVSYLLGTASHANANASTCASLGCKKVVPEASEFRRVDGEPYFQILAADGSLMGWIALSTELVDIKAYSSKPMMTLVAIDKSGVIIGAEVVHHSEPILLVGIEEDALTKFVTRYRGLPAVTRVVVGQSTDAGVYTVDAISGATVTCLAQNRTILDAARKLALMTGAITESSMALGEFVERESIWTWEELIEEEVFGYLRVSDADLGIGSKENTFIELWFTVADAPHVGLSLLEKADYEHFMGALKEGEHLIVVLGSGSSSFKGSGFVRGGIFDRVRIEQGLQTINFRDADYFNLGSLAAPDAPRFKEGAVFVARGGLLDPGEPFDFVFLGSRYASLGKGGFERTFHSFRSSHSLPPTVYREVEFDTTMWKQAWRNYKWDVVLLFFVILTVACIFIQRTWLVGDMRRLKKVHVGTLAVALVVLGFYLRAQPSVTQFLTLLGSIAGDWSNELFLSDPIIFVFWIFIAVTILVWGRGIFCGWLCPYGALSELLYLLREKVGFREFVIPAQLHSWLGYVRYLVLTILILAYAHSPELGETLAEIEPFKTTFYVRPWTRHWALVGWWTLLLGASLVVFRPFCQYLCPLGAALALPSTFRISSPMRRGFCNKCKICPRSCHPRAIDSNGRIDPRICLNCMECEAFAVDVEVCPPLVALGKLPVIDDDACTPAQAKKRERLIQAARIRRG